MCGKGVRTLAGSKEAGALRESGVQRMFRSGDYNGKTQASQIHCEFKAALVQAIWAGEEGPC